MKNLIIIASLLLSLPIMAQTKVVKKNAVKANNFGITYSLPKTSLVVDAEVTKVTCKAGPYYKYAEKYLGVKDAITEDKVYYELGKISLVNKGVPDADNTFIVEFKAGTVAPYAYLTEDGLLCSINAEYTPNESALEAARKKMHHGQKLQPWEQDYYRKNKAMVDLRPRLNPAEIAERQRLQRLLAN